MTNWWSLFSNSIWILAIAFVLAVFSMAYYQAQREGEKLRQVLKTSKYTLILNISGVVFCLGMAAASTKWLEWMFWEILVVLFGIQGWVVIKDRGQETEDGGETGDGGQGIDGEQGTEDGGRGTGD